jgi:hypothetical protein
MSRLRLPRCAGGLDVGVDLDLSLHCAYELRRYSLTDWQDSCDRFTMLRHNDSVLCELVEKTQALCFEFSHVDRFGLGLHIPKLHLDWPDD